MNHSQQNLTEWKSLDIRLEELVIARCSATQESCSWEDADVADPGSFVVVVEAMTVVEWAVVARPD